MDPGYLVFSIPLHEQMVHIGKINTENNSISQWGKYYYNQTKYRVNQPTNQPKKQTTKQTKKQPTNLMSLHK